MGALITVPPTLQITMCGGSWIYRFSLSVHIGAKLKKKICTACSFFATFFLFVLMRNNTFSIEKKSTRVKTFFLALSWMNESCLLL